MASVGATGRPATALLPPSHRPRCPSEPPCKQGRRSHQGVVDPTARTLSPSRLRYRCLRHVQPPGRRQLGALPQRSHRGRRRGRLCALGGARQCSASDEARAGPSRRVVRCGSVQSHDRVFVARVHMHDACPDMNYLLNLIFISVFAPSRDLRPMSTRFIPQFSTHLRAPSWRNFCGQRSRAARRWRRPHG